VNSGGLSHRPRRYPLLKPSASTRILIV
jgi:hypothetical protein